MHPLVWIESGRTKFLRLAMLHKRSRERKRRKWQCMETAKCHPFRAISPQIAFSLQKYKDTESVNKQYEGNTKA